MIDRLVMLRVEREQSLLAVRRRLARDPQWVARVLAAARLRFDEVVVLATCERVEVYGVVGSRPPLASEARRERWRTARGLDAARHLLRVASGLESRIIGETHVLGQVADAARVAAAVESLGPALARLFEAATRTGRRVRAETDLGRLAGSYVRAAAQRIAAGGRIPRAVGVIGSGALARDLVVELDRLGAERVLVYARHPETFRNASQSRRVEIAPLDALPRGIADLDALVAATSSPRALVGADLVADRARPLVIVDLGFPPNVDEAVAAAPHVELVRLADLAGPRHAADVIAAADSIVEAELERLALPTRSVILAAHGAGDDSAANRRVEAVRSEVARQRPRLEARAAFNLGSPGFATAMDASTGDHLTVVPMMTSRGHFVLERLPAALAQGRRVASAPPTITSPVGAVRSLVNAVVRRTIAAARQVTGPMAVVVVGHGTRRTAGSGDATRALASELAEALPHASVAAAFLDESPLLEDIAAEIAQPVCIVVPLLLGGGDHARRDIGRRLAVGACDGPARTKFVVLPALTDDEVASDVVRATLALIDWHAPDRVYRVGTRSSLLALRQTAMAVDALTGIGLRTTVVEIATRGDRDQRTPLEAFDTEGVFTDELESALAEGIIDVAVHSLKDLPLKGIRDTMVAAVLQRGAADEVLVTRDGSTLATLPCAACIGTSSPRRTAQLLAERPDLVTVPLRGPVDARLASIAEGRIDGAILAAAGLERLDAIDRISERLPLERFVPEAGQGAIALTTRGDDGPALAVCSTIDHGPTRAAVEAERAASRAVQAHAGWIAAAHATLDLDGSLRLRVRAINRMTHGVRDAVVQGTTAAEVVERALAALDLGGPLHGAACACTRVRHTSRPSVPDAPESIHRSAHRVLAHAASSHVPEALA